ncbi:hypothetical protein MPDQ_002800 [Monascus purpureus]|uniref:FHA domain-containing protein n=1 Tax=Monascus purpureus TaxID=5098 RepID=A0A507R4L9_MONPU|nr:hypothetical protein MPDQ_002800 [Monascus purpureus]BDD60200.1 hypothetical protein MAP00_005348 [Monascus purpureus]
MSDRQAVVTLHPLFFPDDLPFRSLTFASDSDQISIGRSSKREAKNLVPAHHNAWFDSRVMSRNHATLSISPANKCVYIRDGGSLHGTWVNDQKVPIHQDVAIHSGDVLTFGAEVTRGAETFPPLKVRCECQWFDDRDGASVSKPQKEIPTNCFSVPDYDDDSDIDDYDSVNNVKVERTSSWEDDGSSSPRTSNHPASENSTAVTSPSAKDTDVNISDADNQESSPHISDNTADSNNKAFPNAEQPLVTPRGTSPVMNRPDTEPMPTEVDHSSKLHSGPANSDKGLAASNSSPWGATSVQSDDDWSKEDHFDIDNDSISQSSYGHGVELSNGEDDPVVSVDYSKTESHFHPDVTSSSSHNVDNKYTQQSAHIGPSSHASVAELHQADGPAFSMETHNSEQEQSRPSAFCYNACSFQENWTAKPASGPSPSFRPADRPLDPPLSSIYCFLPTPFDDWAPGNSAATGSYPLQSQSVPSVPYTDGPFVNRESQPEAQNEGTSAHLASSSNDCFRNRLDLRELRQFPNSANLPKPNFSLPSSVGADRETGKQLSGGPTSMKSRVSIADIVDTSPLEPRTIQKPSMKRKAAEMEIDSVGSEPAALAASSSRGHEISLQDAQILPRTPEESTKALPDLVPIQINEEDERRRKRIKTTQESRRRSIVSHVTTAVVGAVVGGLGTVALLASLPPDFFQ